MEEVLKTLLDKESCLHDDKYDAIEYPEFSAEFITKYKLEREECLRYRIR